MTTSEIRPRSWRAERNLFERLLEMNEILGEITAAERTEALGEHTSSAIAEFLFEQPSFGGDVHAMTAAIRKTFDWADDQAIAAGFAKYILAADALIAKALHDVKPAGNA